MLLSKAVSKTLVLMLVLSCFSTIFCFYIPEAEAQSGGITRVQGPFRTTAINSIAAFTVVMDSAPTSGNIVVATVVVASDKNVSATALTQTNVAWSLQKHSYFLGGAANVYHNTQIWVGVVNDSAGTNITVTWSSGHTNIACIVNVCEYSGVLTADFLDQTASSNGETTTTTTGTTDTTTVAPELAIGAVGYASLSNTNQSDPTNGFTLLDGVPDILVTINGNSRLVSNSYLEKTVYVTDEITAGTTALGATLSTWASAIITLKAADYDYQYTFNGVYDENIGIGTTIGAANITAYFDDGTSPLTFELNETIVYSPLSKPLYFYYDIWEYANTSDTSLHREYWLSSDENNGTYNVYGNQQGLHDMVFTIRALGGAGLGSFVTVQRNIDGTLQTVEKRPVDSTGAVVMALQPFTLYSVSIEGTEPNTSTTFGNINTYTTPIVLTVSALSFPSTTLQQYKYLRIWAYRPSSTEISVSYQDTNLQTVSVYYEITDVNGTIHYNYTHTGENSFRDIWSNATSNMTYYLSATVVQSEFGTTTFKQILPAEGTTSSPIDLSFLGTWEFNVYGAVVTLDATQIFWALVVLIIFGSFSVLNAYVGSFAGVAATAVFVWLGWLDIPAGAIALALAFTIVIGIAVYKRRGN